MGYDGKGQVAVESLADIDPAWRELGGVPCVVERRLQLDTELSRSWPERPPATRWRTRSPRTTIATASSTSRSCPLGSRPRSPPKRGALGRAVADALDYIGVLAVELFVSAGRLLVNELAPRPHNSGHWTLDAAGTDQFAQQIRAVTGSALGDASLTAPAVAMVNLLGDLWFVGAAAPNPSNPTGPSCSPSPPPGSTSTGSRRRGPVARWDTSRSSPTTPTARPPWPLPCAAASVRLAFSSRLCSGSSVETWQ